MNWRNVGWKAGEVRGSLAASGYTLAFLVGLCLPAGLVLAANCVAPSTGATAAITLRATPAASSAKRGTLSPGEILPLDASVPGWYETRLADGQMAFAAKRSTQIATCPDGTGVVTAPAEATYELHAIDVGTGLSVLVRGPDFALLYDAGSNGDIARGDDNRMIA